VNILNHKIYHRDKQNLEIRLERKEYEDQAEPIFKGTNIHYEIADRTRGDVNLFVDNLLSNSSDLRIH